MEKKILNGIVRLLHNSDLSILLHEGQSGRLITAICLTVIGIESKLPKQSLKEAPQVPNS